MSFLTWDTGIVAAFAVMLAYCLLLQRHKALAALISSYVAYVLTVAYGSSVAGFFTGDKVIFKSVWVQANATPFAVEMAFFLLTIVVLTIFLKLSGKRSKFKIVEVVLYIVAATLLAVMFITSLMPDDVRANVFAVSKIVPLVYQFRQWIIGLPIILILIFGLSRGGEE